MPGRDIARPSLRVRLVAALIIGALFGVYAYLVADRLMRPSHASDFTYPWIAARALIHGQNPYDAIATADVPWRHVFFYPLPAALVVLPLAPLSPHLAASLFIGIGCALLAFAVTRDGLWRLILFSSGPMAQVCYSMQWSPLLTASALLWPILGVVVAKPNLALPLLIFQTETRAIRAAAILGACLVIVSLVIQPTWPIAWMETFRHSEAGQYRVPLATPVGALLGLAALRWRRPDGRLLLAMACMPQNGFFYDQLPLLLIPSNRIEMVIASTISGIAWIISRFTHIDVSGTTALSAAYLPYVMFGLYLPALVIVLRRPNEGLVLRWPFHRRAVA